MVLTVTQAVGPPLSSTSPSYISYREQLRSEEQITPSDTSEDPAGDKINYIGRKLAERLGHASEIKVKVSRETLEKMGETELEVLTRAAIPQSYSFLKNMNISYCLPIPLQKHKEL